MTNFYDDKPYVGLDVNEYSSIFDMADLIKESGIDNAEMEELKAEHDRISQVKLQSNIEQFYLGIQNAWQGMKISDLEAKRADAIHEGQSEIVAELEQKISNAKKEFEQLKKPAKPEGFWSTAGSVVASAGRNMPEMIGTAIATGAISTVAPGVGTAAGGARMASILARGAAAVSKYRNPINAAVNSAFIYNDTVDIARGDIYSKLEQQYPEMPEEEKYKASYIGGRLIGSLEAGTGFFGIAKTGSRVVGSIGAKGVGAVAKRFGKKTVETGVNKEVKDAVEGAITNSLATGVINEKNFLSPTVRKAILEGATFAGEAFYEGVTENLQDRVEKSILNAVANDQEAGYTDTLVEGVSDLAGVYTSIVEKVATGVELTDDEKSVLATLMNVSLSSAALGGVYRGVGYAIDKIDGSKKQTNIVGQIAQAKKTVESLDRVMEVKRDSNLRKKHPELVDKMIKNLSKTGRIPEKLYTDVDALSAILQKAKDDTIIQRQVAKLNIAQKIESAKKGDGIVEFDIDEIYDTLLDPDNDKLYQTIKNDLIENPENMSINDVNSMLADITKNDNMISDAIKDKNSMYNYTMNSLIAGGVEEKQAQTQAVLAQFMFNTMATWGKVPVSMEELMQDINLKIKTGEFAERIPEKPKAKKAKKKKPLSLLAFLKKKGGLKDSGGELKAMDARFRVGLVNNQTGLDLDTARELAEEAGYFGVAAMNNLGTTSVSDLLELIRTELGGQKVYSEIDSIPEQQEDMDEAEYRAEEILDENNIDYSRMTLEEKLKLASQLISKPQPEGAGLEGIDIDELFRLYDTAYVSMPTEMVGDKLDADRFEGTGEDAAAHGWGNYLLQSREKDEKYYYEKFKKPRVLLKGKPLVFDGSGDYILYMLNKYAYGEMSFEGVLNTAKRDLDKYNKEIKYKKEKMDQLVSDHELDQSVLDDLREYSEKGDNADVALTTRIYEISEKRGAYSSWFRALQDIKRLEKTLQQIKTLLKTKQSDVKIDNTAALYEAEVPENKFLLDEQATYKDQSDYVKERLEKVFSELAFPAKKEARYQDKDAAKEFYDHQMDLYTRNGQGYERLMPEVDELADGTFVIKYVEKYDFYVRDENIKYASGRDIYDNISDYLGSQKAASKLLLKHGIKGIVYEGGRDGTGYVIFSGDDVQITQRLLQQEGQYVAGWFQRNAFESIIALTTAAKPETFAHEAFHLFSNQMIREFNAGRLNKQWERNVKTLAKWAGFEFGEDGKITPNKKGEEKLAVAFTRYLATGKAPVGYLKQMFDILAEMFMNLYGTLRGMLNKRVTNVFDQIFVPYERHLAEQARRKLGFIAKPENMSLEAYERYIAEKRALTVRATTKEIQAALALQKVMTEDVYQAEREQAYNDAYNELMDMPVYQMLADVAEGKIQIRDLPRGVVINDPKLVGKDGKILLSQLWAQYKDIAATPEEIVELINTTPRIEDVANYIAEQHMQEWIAENKPELVDIQSEIAQRNERAFRLAVMEYMMLSDMNMERFNAVHNDMVGAAEYIYDKMDLAKAINVERWIEQEAKLLQKYEYITDPKKQAEFKRRQAIINYFAMRAKETRIDQKRFSKKIKKYRSNPDKQDLKTMDGTTWDLLKAILYNFKFTKSKPNSDPRFIGEQFDSWIKECIDDGFTMAADLEQYRDTLVNGVEEKPTFADFEFARKIFSYIESIGLQRKIVKLKEQAKNIEDVVDAVQELYAQRGTKRLENLSAWERFKYKTIAVKETLLKEVMPSEFNEMFVLPLMEGFTRKSIAISEWTKQVEEIIKPIAKRLSERVEIDGRYYNIQNLLVMMLNGGNTHNLECIVRTLQETFGEDYNYDDYLSAITQAPVELRGIAEAIWDIFDRNLPDFLAIQKEIDGKTLRVVPAEPLTLGDGTVLKGGYYPIKAKKKVLDFSDQNAIRQGDGLYATHSFQKDRKTGIHGDLDLTLETLHTWFYRMAGVLHVAIPYNNLVRVLKNKRFQAIVGTDMVDALNQWIELANKPDEVNKALLVGDTIMSAKILGFSVLKTLTQMTGIFSALGYVPSKYLLHAISPRDLYRAVGKASQLSNYMKERYNHPEEHLNLYVRAKSMIGVDLSERGVKFREFVMNAAMSFIVYGDAFASMTTWNAEYQRQIDSGKSHEQSVLLADQAVRITQGDSAAGSRPPIVQGNMRFFTKFASYFIALNSRLTAIGMNPNQKARIAGIVLATCVLAPAADALFKTVWETSFGEGDDDEDFAMKYLKQTAQSIGSTTGAAFMPAFGIASAVGSGITGGRVYSPSMPALEFYMTPAYISSDIFGAFADDEKTEKHLKNILIKLLEAGTIKSDYTKAFLDIVEGE